MSVARVLVCAAIGGLACALAPRVVYRLSVHYGEPPRAACGDCGAAFPAGLRGWVRLSGRCPRCGRRLGPPGWLTALAGAVSCGALAWAVGSRPLVLAAFLVVAVCGVFLAAIDLTCLRLPDVLVAGGAAVALGLLGAAALAGGELAPLVRALAGAATLGAVYLVLALVPGARLGFGDVKLAAVLGLLLGWVGWGAVLLGALFPHLINGPVVVGLLLTGRADRRTDLPLGPALLGGALAAIVVAAALAR